MRIARLIALVALAAVAVAVAGTAATARPHATAAKPVTITFWHAYAENPAAPEMQRLTKIVIPRFEKLNPGIKVQQVPFSYSSLQQKLTTSAAGGTLPDLIRSDLAWVPQYAKLGVFAPLNKVMPDFKRFASAMFPGTLATNYYRGNYYGLPLDTNTRVLMYNREALTAAGISSPPSSFADLRADASKLKAKGVYLFADGGTGGWNVLPWIWSGGGSLTDAKFTKASGFLNSPRSVAAVQLLVDLYKQGALPSLILGDAGAVGTENGLADGKYATILDGPWMLPIFAKAHPGFRVSTAPVPAGPGGSVSVVGGEDIVLTASSKKKAAALQFLRFMISPWAQTQMAHAGQMPVRKDVSKNLTKINPGFAIFAKQLETARPRTPDPNWPKIDSVLATAVASAIKGDKSAQAALDDAAKQIDSLLAS
jgi:ABC-type glycerol-3-phosphate transport system substrate-binding protein